MILTRSMQKRVREANARRTPTSEMILTRSMQKRVREANAGAASSLLSGESDILWLVLERLAIRVLFRCMTVCRAWKDVISNPCFRRQYLSSPARSAGAASGFVSVGGIHPQPQEDRELEPPACSFAGLIFSHAKLPNNSFPADVKVVASSCGVLLLGNKGRYLVLNTLTGATDELPEPPTSNSMGLITFTCHEPRVDCDSNYDYEIVRMPDPQTNARNGNSYQMEAYSSRTREWSQCPVPRRRAIWSRRSYDLLITLEGTMYWSMGRGESGAFDPKAGRVEDPPLPPCRRMRMRRRSPGRDDSPCILFYLDYDNNKSQVVHARANWIRTVLDGTTTIEKELSRLQSMNQSPIKRYAWVLHYGSQELRIPYIVPSWPFRL